MKYDFIIYGSGISAKLSSIALAKEGFSVCIILDNKLDINKDTNLVTFLSSGSINYITTKISNFSELEKFQNITEIHCQHENLNGVTDQFIKFSEKEKGILGKIIPNIAIENCINNDLGQNKNLEIIENAEIINVNYSDTGVSVKLHNKGEYFGKLLIISTSKNENLLKNTNIKFIKKDFLQDALSIQVKGEFKKNNSAFQKFTQEGPIAFLPYNKNEASVVWSVHTTSQFLLEKEDLIREHIKSQLHEHISNLEICSIERHKLKFSFAKRLFFKKAVLIGNSAHNIHPIAGQGLNLSIKDIALFIKIVSKYKSIGYEINNDLILSKFDLDRKLDNTAYSFGTLTLDNILSSKNKTLNFFVGQGIKIVERNNFLKSFFIKSATGEKFFKSI